MNHGIWKVECYSDERWCNEGRTNDIDSCKEMTLHIQSCRELYGSIPSDATFEIKSVVTLQ